MKDLSELVCQKSILKTSLNHQYSVGIVKDSDTIITVNLFDAFQEYVVFNEEDIISDHLPYLVNFKISNRNTIKNLNFNKKANADKPKSYNYKKADWKMFKSLLPKCIIPNNENNENNVEFIDGYVCNSLIKAADQAIPIF